MTSLLFELNMASLPPKPNAAPTGRLNHFGAWVVAEFDAELKASLPAWWVETTLRDKSSRAEIIGLQSSPVLTWAPDWNA